MRTLQKILAIIWKDTRLRFSSLMEWLFFLILPVVFTVILAGGTAGPEDPRVRLVAADQANTPLSQELLALLAGSPAVDLEILPLAQAEEEFAARRVAALLVTPAGFGADTLQAGLSEVELRLLPDNLDAMAASQAVQAVLRQVSSGVEIARQSTAEVERIRAFDSETARQAYFDAALENALQELAGAPTRLAVTEAAPTGSTQDDVDYDPRASSSAGQMITWVFVPLLGISASFAYERQVGALRRLLTTPTRKSTFLLGAIAGNVLLAVVQMLLLVGFGILVIKVGWGRAPGALAAILLAAALAGAALGAALGAYVKTDSQASGASILLGMLMALLGGCWYPLELFPPFMRTASLVLPTRWAMQGMLDILLRGQGLAGVLPEVGVLLGFAALFFAIGVGRFRYE